MTKPVHEGHDEILPGLPHYKRNMLRPNPHTADPTEGDLAFVSGTNLIGDFGDGDQYGGAGGAAVRPALGLPPAQLVTPKGNPIGRGDRTPDDETSNGWR